jgi:FkbH-like protein
VAELNRKHQAEGYGNDYEAFLRACKMEARLFAPSNSEHVERCLELLSRSNQLNLSTYRYTRQELEQLMKSHHVISICTACRDRFGDYGLIGFAAIELSEGSLCLKDFVLSCRVAQKKLENAWFRWLLFAANAAGYPKIHARYVKTSRNAVLRNVLKEVGFVETESGPDGTLLSLSCSVLPPASDIVSVDAVGVGEIPPSAERIQTKVC